jgi:hypothetical protein
LRGLCHSATPPISQRRFDAWNETDRHWASRLTNSPEASL